MRTGGMRTGAGPTIDPARTSIAMGLLPPCIATPARPAEATKQGRLRSRAPNPGEAHIRRSADKLKAKWHVLDTDHYPMLSTPDQLTKIITEG